MASPSPTRSSRNPPSKRPWTTSTIPAGWIYIDGVESHRRAPETFDIPTKAEIMDLVVGDYVKMGFRFPAGPPPNGERMWVKITKLKRSKKGHFGFVGVLDNDPTLCWPDLKCGDVIEFEDRHILSTHDQNENYEKYAHVSVISQRKQK